MNSNGDIVSYLNLTSVRPEDSGRYTCRAHNSRGTIEHSTRLNVYGKKSSLSIQILQKSKAKCLQRSPVCAFSGPPSIRNVGPIRVVAGVNTTIYCPYSGFPIRLMEVHLFSKIISFLFVYFCLYCS